MRNIFVTLFFLLFASCSSYNIYSSNLNSKVSLNKDIRHTKKIKFEIKKNYFLWGIIPGEYNIDVSKELTFKGYDNLSSLKLKKFNHRSDIFWSILSLGFYIPQTFEISGQSTVK